MNVSVSRAFVLEIDAVTAGIRSNARHDFCAFRVPVLCFFCKIMHCTSNQTAANIMFFLGLQRYDVHRVASVVPRTGIEPVRRLSLAADFKSAVSTNFTIGASAHGAGGDAVCCGAGGHSTRPCGMKEAGAS